jgi:hypothetical protein
MKKLVRTCSLAVIAGWSFALVARGDENAPDGKLVKNGEAEEKKD